MAEITTATKKLLKLTNKIRAIGGGTGASKTYSIVMILIDYAQSNKNEKIDVVSESYPHLEAGVMQDFREVMVSRGYWKDDRWNGTKHTYNFETGSVFKFMSVDKLGKAHGPRRDVLFLNECNYIPYDVADQLITRTRKVVWMDWNPTSEFWYYTEMEGKRKDIDFLKLTYEDNEALTEKERQEIEAHKNNKNWWRVYGLGELGEVEGRIYKDWKIIDEIPHEARLERYGLDFGYSNDPTAIVAVYYWNGGYIFDEILFRKGISNKQIADTIINQKEALVIADSAEPKSIDEIASYGVNITAATKGPGSVVHRIQIVQDKRISVTQRSVNVIKEYRNYLWKTDTNGKVLNVPEHAFSHSMDALSYAMSSLAPEIRQEEYLQGIGRRMAQAMAMKDKQAENPAL